MSNIGNYRILRQIGEGSMGVVYLAETGEGEQVAIKTFSISDESDDKERDLFRQLLKREGRRTLELDHPNIVRTLDVVDEEDLTYIVMEYVEGLNLDQYLKVHGRLEPGQAIGLLKQAAAALDYAAGMGLAHRDVKPANMLLSKDGSELKLTDFGIAKRISDYTSGASASASTSTLSETHRVGTLRYMAPEQITEPQKVTERADQYSLASIAYILLTGRGVFHDKTSETSLGFAIVNTIPPRPSEFNRDLKRIDKVMRRGLAKRPAERYESCAEYVTALEDALFAPRPGLPRWIWATAAGIVFVLGLVWAISYLQKSEKSDVTADNHPRTGTDSTRTDSTGADSKRSGGSDGAGGPARTDGGTGHVTVDRPPPPPPPPVRRVPDFALSILANDKVLPANVSFSKDDENYGLLGIGDLRASVKPLGDISPAVPVTLEWEVNGLTRDSADLGGRFRKGPLSVAYSDRPTSGSYRIRLLVDGKEKQTFEFRIQD